jgi:hypothetical protein
MQDVLRIITAVERESHRRFSTHVCASIAMLLQSDRMYFDRMHCGFRSSSSFRRRSIATPLYISMHAVQAPMGSILEETEQARTASAEKL